MTSAAATKMRRWMLRSEQPKRQPAKEGKPERSAEAGVYCRSASAMSQGDSKRKSQKKPESAAADTAAQQPESTTHGEVSAFALARVLGRQLLKVVPTPTALSKIKEQQTQIVKVEGKDGKKGSAAHSAQRDVQSQDCRGNRNHPGLGRAKPRCRYAGCLAPPARLPDLSTTRRLLTASTVSA